METKVSVIIPVFNREKLIERTLNSVLYQTCPPDEIIAVDNCSTDDSYDTIRHWMKKNEKAGINFTLLKQEKKGACHTRQKGLENAKGDYIIFFDSDDEMLPDLIQYAKKTLQNNPDADIICWSCRIKQLDGSIRIPPFDSSNPIENHLIHTLLRPQGYMVKKNFLNKNKGWTKEIMVWDDLELGLRLLLENPKLIGINKILAHINAQEESITGTDFTSKEGQWEKTLDEMEKSVKSSRHESKNKILNLLDYRRSILAAHYYKENNKEAAKQLLSKSLKNKKTFDKLILKFSYNYTRKGFRGAFRVVKHFIRNK